MYWDVTREVMCFFSAFAAPSNSLNRWDLSPVLLSHKWRAVICRYWQFTERQPSWIENCETKIMHAHFFVCCENRRYSRYSYFSRRNVIYLSSQALKSIFIDFSFYSSSATFIFRLDLPEAYDATSSQCRRLCRRRCRFIASTEFIYCTGVRAVNACLGGAHTLNFSLFCPKIVFRCARCFSVRQFESQCDGENLFDTRNYLFIDMGR